MPETKIIQIPGFKGGRAQDEYDNLNKQTFQTAKDLEVFSPSNTLAPHFSLGTDTTATGGDRNTIKLDSAYKASDGRYYFKGFDKSAGTTLTIFDAGVNLGSSTALTAETTASGAGGGFGIVEFLEDLFYYESSTRIQAFDIGGSTIVTNAVAVNNTCPIFVHEGLKKMFYTVSAYQIGSTASTTISASAALAFDTTQKVKMMAAFGQFVAVAVTPTGNSKSSKVAIWDGSATTIDDLIDVGDAGIQGIANVSGAIYILTSSNSDTTGLVKFNVIRLYRWSGGKVELVYELDLKPTVVNTVSINPAAIATSRDTLYFGMNASTANSMTIDNGIYAYNTRTGIFTLDRITEDTSDVNITSIQYLDGEPVVTWTDGTNYRINHIQASGSKSAVGVYESNRFRLDPYRRGRIKRIKIHHDTLPASTGYTVKVKHFGKYPKGATPPSEESFTTLATQTTANSTFTIAEDPTVTKWCNEAQIQITFDTISGTSAPAIVFPLSVEVEISDEM